MKNILEELSNAMVEAVALAEQTTVMVNARKRIPASGIGFGPDLILTADHVIEKEDDIPITLYNGVQGTAKLAGRDPGSDLALLKFESKAIPSALPVKEPVRIGQIVLALGRPSSTGIEASLGVISALGGPLRNARGGLLERYIRTDTIAYPGFSGGPLVDAAGAIVGINTSGLWRGASLTIPADLAWRIADSLAKYGQVKRAYLGVRSQEVELPKASIELLEARQNTGLLLLSVERNSPADRAGLTVSDILVGIGDKPVMNQDELFTLLGTDLAGKKEAVHILRGGQLINLDIHFKQR